MKTLIPEGGYAGRVCNSDDPEDAAESGLCFKSNFDYPEIQIHNADWEASIFLSWIMQIVLMEILEVPVTVGLGPRTHQESFYAPDNSVIFSTTSYPWDAIRTANDVKDCRLTTADCAHVMVEVWNSQVLEWTDALEKGYIDPVEGNGQVGKVSLYVPVFTANRDDTLISFYGLQGESNRRKVAEAFKRPTTWADYCQEDPENRCTESDSTARRFPEPTEEDLYFSEGLFDGYFRATEKNDCDKNNATCTGHIVGPSCTWSNTLDQQIYWNDLTLEPDGPLAPNGGYSYPSMIQIWRAANATKENAIFWWWAPEALVEEFHDTDASFQQVLMPQPTEVCSRSRATSQERCSDDITVRRGKPEGACDQEAHALQKVFAKSLREVTYSFDAADRSPGYDFLLNLKITDIEVNDIITRWMDKNVDKYGNDAREAVCGWVVDHLDYLHDFIPIGYPRVLSDDWAYDLWYLYIAQALACFTWFCVSTASYTAFENRERKVFVHAQVYFIQLLLLGFSMISVGALITAMEPSKGTCVAVPWLITLGYSVALIPTLVKTSIINKALRSGIPRRRRVVINPRRMAYMVLAPLVCIIAYISAWTAIDPLVDKEVRVLLDESGEDVSLRTRCESESSAWYLISMGWIMLLLLLASTIAYQSQNIPQEFNESKTLGRMVYSHLLFMIMRIIVYFLAEAESIQPNVAAALVSLNYSVDVCLALGIYLVPKMLVSKGKRAQQASLHRNFGMSSLEQSSAALTLQAETPGTTTLRQGVQQHEGLPRDMFVQPLVAPPFMSSGETYPVESSEGHTAPSSVTRNRRRSSASTRRGSGHYSSDDEDIDTGGPQWPTKKLNKELNKAIRASMQ